MSAEWLFAIKSQEDVDDMTALVDMYNIRDRDRDRDHGIVPSGRPGITYERSHVYVSKRATTARFAKDTRFCPLKYGGALLRGGQIYLRYISDEPELGNAATVFMEAHCPLPATFPTEIIALNRSRPRARDEIYISNIDDAPRRADETRVAPPYMELVMRAVRALEEVGCT